MMQLLKIAPALWAAQQFAFPLFAECHQWESRQLFEFPEGRDHHHAPSYHPYQGDAGRVHHGPDVFQTAFFAPVEPSNEEISSCQLNYSLHHIVDPRRFGNVMPWSVTVQVNQASRSLEFHVQLEDVTRLSREGRDFLEDGNVLVVSKPIPSQCMYYSGDPKAFFVEERVQGRLQAIFVNLTPEVSAVYRPSKSVMPRYTLTEAALVDGTFVPAGSCMIATVVKSSPESLVVEGSLNEVVIKEIVGGGKYKPLRQFRWFDCRCAPQKFRDLAVWLERRGDSTLVVVHSGRNPAYQDPRKCKVETLNRPGTWATTKLVRQAIADTPLVAP